MKNIVIFSDKRPPDYGGMETHFLYFWDYFTKHNKWKCLFLVSKKNDKHQVLDSDFTVVAQFYYAEEVILFLKQFNINVFFFNSGHWIEDLEYLRKDNNDALFCLRTGGNDFAKASLSQNLSLKKRQEYWAYQINTYIDFIISNSKFTNQRLEIQGVIPSKIKLVRGGYCIKKATHNILNKETSRNKFYIKYNIIQPFIITISSRLVKFKNIDNIIKAIRLSANKNKIFFLIIGDGAERCKLIKQCEINLNKKSWKFIGSKNQEEAMEIISIADIYISSSIEHKAKSVDDTYIHTETMGRSILEAISQNIKIIATDVGGVKEWFSENKNLCGYLIEQNNPTQMAQTIDKLLLDNKSKELSFERYSWNAIFTKYINMWEYFFEKKY